VAAVRESLLSVKDTERMVERMSKSASASSRRKRRTQEGTGRPAGAGLPPVREHLKKSLRGASRPGMDAVCRVVESETEYSVTVAIPKYGKAE
jgi:hypothetical protein